MVELLSNFWFLLFLAITIPSVVATVAGVWQKARRAALETALTQEMLRRGLSVEEIERLLRARHKPPETSGLPSREKAIEELAECLGQCGASGPVIEQVLAAVRDADPPSGQAVCRAVRGLMNGSGQEAKDEQLLAVVRGLCRPADSAAPPGPRPPVEIGIQTDPDRPGALSLR